MREQDQLAFWTKLPNLDGFQVVHEERTEEGDFARPSGSHRGGIARSDRRFAPQGGQVLRAERAEASSSPRKTAANCSARRPALWAGSPCPPDLGMMKKKDPPKEQSIPQQEPSWQSPIA